MRPGRVSVCIGTVASAIVAATGATADGLAHHASVARQLAYVRGRAHSEIWVGRGHAARRLGAGTAPSVSPNGAFVAAGLNNSSGAALRLYTIGGPTHGFLDARAGSAYPLAWSSDARYLAVLSYGTPQNLYVIDTATMSITRVARGYVSGASFAPRGVGPRRDELVYGLARSQRPSAAVNLWVSAPDGRGKRRITTNGRSLNPLWTRKGIVFDRERLRRRWAPVYQLWLRHGARTRRLTHLRVGRLVVGLVPVAASASGNRLIAEFEGQDTSNAWRVQIAPRRVSRVRVRGGAWVQGYGISRNGRRLLIDQGAFMQPANRGTVESVGFFGGHLHRLARGADPSWNH